MNQMQPNNSSNSYSSFSACDNIAAFYDALGVPGRKTVGPFGGHSYTWYPTDSGQPFQVRCDSKVLTLGYGVLHTQSRIASDMSCERWFRGHPVVNPDTYKILMEGMFGFSQHEIRLPAPDKPKE